MDPIKEKKIQSKTGLGENHAYLDKTHGTVLFFACIKNPKQSFLGLF